MLLFVFELPTLLIRASVSACSCIFVLWRVAKALPHCLHLSLHLIAFVWVHIRRHTRLLPSNSNAMPWRPSAVLFCNLSNASVFICLIHMQIAGKSMRACVNVCVCVNADIRFWIQTFFCCSCSNQLYAWQNCCCFYCRCCYYFCFFFQAKIVVVTLFIVCHLSA